MDKRHAVQLVWTALTNSYVTGFYAGKLYKGDLKKICVPGLNCYSCPGALGSCPLGALQAVIGSRAFSVSCYAAGFLLLIGALVGRFVCGWLCPFGLVQEALSKIPFPRKIRKVPGDRFLRLIKWVVLAILVLLLPAILNDVTGNAPPFFCKWLCPAGTLEAGLPLMLLAGYGSAAGWLTAWKISVLAAVLILSIAIYRPFCRYLCPLGAVYGALNPVSLYRLRVDENACVRCGACAKVCEMGVALPGKPNSPECIRCGKCVRACPGGALSMGFSEPQKKRQPSVKKGTPQ